MKAKEIAMNFFGRYHNMDDGIYAILKERSWHVILSMENSRQVEVLVDSHSGKILSYVSLDANLHHSN